ncbi:MAG: glycosyltransferase family 4 protein [Pseudomonadota bacterium]
MDNLTVLQVIPALHTGGAERTAVDVAGAIRTAGGRALVASEGGRLEADLTAVGGEHITMPMASKNPAVMAINAFRLGALIRARGVDLIHARSRAPAWSALAAARRTGIPLVTTYHGAYNQENAIKGFYNSVMARADVVIANSGYTADLIRHRHPFAKDRITIVHRGSDLAAFAPDQITSARIDRLRGDWAVPKGKRIILQMARLTAWKGQTVLIDALARLADKGIEDWIAVLAGDAQGRDSYRTALNDQIAALGLKDRVRLVGHCDDVAAAMVLADAVAVASTEPEAFGRAAVEAQAAGTPVVVTDLGAVRETVLAPPECAAEARTGWRVPSADPDRLAEAMHALLDLGEEEKRALAERARAHVESRFSLAAMTERTLDVYRRLIAPPGSH